MVKITKHNVQSVIEKILKEYRISWHLESSDDNYYLLYQLNISSSVNSFIQIESSKDVDEVYVSLYSMIDGVSDRFFHEVGFEADEVVDLEDEIQSLINSVKDLYKATTKIFKKIEDIKTICEENGLDHEYFIEVLVDIE
jgi:hypothetical protein